MTQRGGVSEGGAGLERGGGGTGEREGKGRKKEDGKTAVGEVSRVSSAVLGILPGQPRIQEPLGWIFS